MTALWSTTTIRSPPSTWAVPTSRRLYADQTEADHAALVKAADKGIVPIGRGP